MHCIPTVVSRLIFLFCSQYFPDSCQVQGGGRSDSGLPVAFDHKNEMRQDTGNPADFSVDIDDEIDDCNLSDSVL